MARIIAAFERFQRHIRACPNGIGEGFHHYPIGEKVVESHMIDLQTETLIPLREVPKRLPPRPNGKRVHISACYRWIQRGVRGVRLESIQIGGMKYTSLEALQRFGLQLSGDNESAGKRPTPAMRKRQIERASQRLQDLLGPTDDQFDSAHYQDTDGKAVSKQ